MATFQVDGGFIMGSARSSVLLTKDPKTENGTEEFVSPA
jgi:hypothetical protein